MNDSVLCFLIIGIIIAVLIAVIVTLIISYNRNKCKCDDVTNKETFKLSPKHSNNIMKLVKTINEEPKKEDEKKSLNKNNVNDDYTYLNSYINNC